MLEPHLKIGIILGRLTLMWMKAELTKGPHSCPVGPTAPLIDLVQLPAQHHGKYYPLLAEPDPTRVSSGAIPLVESALSYPPHAEEQRSEMCA
jgi:hypothetical protein